MEYQINDFYSEFLDYIDYNKKSYIKYKYLKLYKNIRRKLFKNSKERIFIRNYKHLDKYIGSYNDRYIDNFISNNTFDKVNGYELDYNQKRVIITDEVNSLVIAGAGSGKTLTMIGKINYLIKHKNINPLEILCISFTNEACNNLKNKIDNRVEVLTFHKLALKIIGKDNYKITSISLEYIVNEYFNCIIYNNYLMIKKVLKILKIKIDSNYINTYNKAINSKEFTIIKRTIISFINLFKANNYDVNKFLKIKNRNNKDILSIILDIYYLYNQELHSQGEIDFNDMINLASNYIINNKLNLHYKYIIVDEYQDTSYTRYLLLKAIKDTCSAKLIAVGDDWQSIYKFTGCNLDIFLKFEHYFGYTKKLYILNTYRNCQELINVASNFIKKNKKQIKKQLKSVKHLYKPIKIIYERENILEILLKYLASKKVDNIMILGRNNKDIYKYITDDLCITNNTISYKKYEFLHIKYLTVHKSKGLEEDCVIIINLIDDYLGFPSKIINADIVNNISPKSNCLYEEERRLFYVALTRTKGYVYLIIPKMRESIFVKEIIKYNKKHIEYLDIS